MLRYPETIRYYYHPLKTLWFLPPVTIFSVLMLRQLHKVNAWPQYILMAAGAILFLLLCIHYIRVVYWAITRKPVLVLSPKSLQVYGKIKPILWADIEDIEEGTLFLKAGTGEGTRGKLNRLPGNRRQKIRLPIDLLKGKAADIDEVLYEYHRQATTPRPS